MLAYKTVSTIFLAWLCCVDALIVPSSVNYNRSSRSFSASLHATASKTTHRRKNKGSKQTNQISVTTQEPWLADYSTSVRSQKKIQSVPSKLRGKIQSCPSGTSCPKHFLNIPSSECNAANVVCALTTSAKTLSRGKHVNNKLNTTSEDLQTALMQTIDILNLLVTDKRLTARQLCNAAWAIAKHVEYDASLFSRDKYILVKDSSKSYSTWDLSQQQMSGDGTDKHIDDVLNLIALRMVEHLEQTRDRKYRIKTGKRAQPGELSMLLWAYAAAKPRDCPPGWEQPRRIEQLSDTQNTNSDNDFDVVTFVKTGRSFLRKVNIRQTILSTGVSLVDCLMRLQLRFAKEKVQQ
ncbi:hypothetical protein QTG54_000735 [Skeletonema marinoi]|uniref:Uncharacterized protein n=1 Tax=Skeletonema marinoi TaxID=267567 RepID=A0AAD9DI82_9STRA|nr:hypothetical protein QTG54_000735 [Skeletonema marinoi]